MAFMYDEAGRKIGTKTRKIGGGLEYQNGFRGDSITMKFETPQQDNSIIKKLATTKKSNFPNNFPNGIKPPTVELQRGEENTQKIGNFLQYLKDRRNADMMQKYDSMNLKNRQFGQELQNRKYQASQDRAQQSYLQKQRLAQQQNQFNKTYDFNTQKFDRTHDFEMQKYLHPRVQKQDTSKYKIERTKIFTKDPSAIIPKWKDLDENSKIEAMRQYVNTGEIPKIEGYDGVSWFGKDYRIANQDNKPQTKQDSYEDYEKRILLEYKKSMQQL